MIRRLLLALALALAGGSSAFAAPLQPTFNVSPFPPFLVGYVTTTAATPFTAAAIQPGVATRPASWLVGIRNVSTAAQTGTLTCYDNASSASGTIVDVENTMAAGSQAPAIPYPGIPLVFGLTCISSATVVTTGGSGYQVQYL